MSIIGEESVQTPSRAKLYAGLIILLALVLRLYHLGRESLWIDEGFSLRDIGSLQFLDGTRPLYFALMSVWMKLVHSRSEFALRIPAAVFGVLSVPVFYAIGKRLLGYRAALLASFFMAISVLHINHSREIRMYSLAVLASLLATYFMFLWLDHGKKIHLAGYVISAVSSLLTFPLCILILMAHGLFLILYVKTYRPRAGYLIGALLCVAGVWMPWMMNNMREAAGFSEGYTSIIEKPTVANLIPFMGRFFLWKWSDPGKSLHIAAVLFSVGIVFLAILGLRKLGRMTPELSLVLIWFAVPIVSMIGLSYTLSNVWMPHYMIAISPALFLMVGNGIASIRSRQIATVTAVLLTLVVFGRLHLYYSKHVRPEWKSAVTYVEQQERPGDVIGIYYGGNQFVFDYYYRGRSKWSEVGDDHIERSHFTGWDSKRAGALMGSFPLSGKRCWLMLSNHDYAGGSVIVKYIESNYRVIDHEYYSQIETLLFDAGGQPVPSHNVHGHLQYSKL